MNASLEASATTPAQAVNHVAIEPEPETASATCTSTSVGVNTVVLTRPQSVQARPDCVNRRIQTQPKTKSRGMDFGYGGNLYKI